MVCAGCRFLAAFYSPYFSRTTSDAYKHRNPRRRHSTPTIGCDVRSGGFNGAPCTAPYDGAPADRPSRDVVPPYRRAWYLDAIESSIESSMISTDTVGTIHAPSRTPSRSNPKHVRNPRTMSRGMTKRTKYSTWNGNWG